MYNISNRYISFENLYELAIEVDSVFSELANFRCI